LTVSSLSFTHLPCKYPLTVSWRNPWALESHGEAS
jgi:hypothetical protein